MSCYISNVFYYLYIICLKTVSSISALVYDASFSLYDNIYYFHHNVIIVVGRLLNMFAAYDKHAGYKVGTVGVCYSVHECIILNQCVL